MYRFYVPNLVDQPAGSVVLPDDQTHHALSVLRLTPDTDVLLFDGAGHSAPAIITATAKRSLSLKLTAPITTDPLASPALTIAVAVPKADRADWLIEQASQLNVSHIQWLTTDRTVVKPKEGGGKLDKHHRLAIESAKQCHRTHVLQISAPIGLDVLLKNLSAYQQTLWLEPGEASAPIRQILQSPLPTPYSILALIGPEGGWSPREHALLEPLASANRISRIRLTPTILRIETAAAAVAAIIMS